MNVRIKSTGPTTDNIECTVDGIKLKGIRIIRILPMKAHSAIEVELTLIPESIDIVAQLIEGEKKDD